MDPQGLAMFQWNPHVASRQLKRQAERVLESTVRDMHLSALPSLQQAVPRQQVATEVFQELLKCGYQAESIPGCWPRCSPWLVPRLPGVTWTPARHSCPQSRRLWARPCSCCAAVLK